MAEEKLLPPLKATKKSSLPFKTRWSQFFSPEAVPDAIKKGDQKKVRQLLDAKRASADFSYGGCPLLKTSIDKSRDEITLALLTCNPPANPDIEYDFRSVGGPKGKILQSVIDRKDGSNTRLLILYGATLDGITFAGNPHMQAVAKAVLQDYRKYQDLEKSLVAGPAHGKEKTYEDLAKFWKTQAEAEAKENPIYSAHYLEKSKDILSQKESFLAQKSAGSGLPSCSP